MIMLSAEGIAEVARTGQPFQLGSWRLTVDDLIQATTTEQWVGMYVELTPDYASYLAAVLNTAKPWKRNRRPAALTAAPQVIEGTVLA